MVKPAEKKIPTVFERMRGIESIPDCSGFLPKIAWNQIERK